MAGWQIVYVGLGGETTLRILSFLEIRFCRCPREEGGVNMLVQFRKLARKP
ncbi:hypothetical protein J6590_097464 [Homalodisca vitripennis]|nr:hypothetical protein J6590_097464 [Homalodisca vitripennis]